MAAALPTIKIRFRWAWWLRLYLQTLALLHGTRYVGFYPCCPRIGCGGEPDPLLGSRAEPIYT